MRCNEIVTALVIAGALVLPATGARGDRVDVSMAVQDDADIDNFGTFAALGTTFSVQHVVQNGTCTVEVSSDLPNKIAADPKGKSAKVSQTAASFVSISTTGTGGGCDQAVTGPCTGNPEQARISGTAKGDGTGNIVSVQLKSDFKADLNEFTPAPGVLDLATCEDALSDQSRAVSFEEKNGTIKYKATLKSSTP